MIQRIIIWFAILLIFCAPVSGGDIRSELSRTRKIADYVSPGRWRWLKCKIKTDPVQALTESEISQLKEKGKEKSDFQQIVNGFVDRALKVYAEKYDFPDELVTFLQNNKEARNVFIPALNFRYDNIGNAAQIFDEIRKLDEKMLLYYIHLATAIAVVYDDEKAVSGSRFSCIWGMKKEQFPAILVWKDVWDYYTNSRNTRFFAFRINKLSWPVLVNLVDNDITVEDRSWVLKKYKKSSAVKSTYGSVKYDYSKIASKGPGKLGSNQYTLSNLYKYGGICGDQAHFTSRVAKTLGIPSMKVAGKGRYGGAGHAWAGFLKIDRKKLLLDFTGRYNMDYYYVGDIYDPQTKTFTLDRYVAMMYDGASLSYPKYNKSMILTRIAEASIEDHPSESFLLTGKALETNYFNMWAWPLLMEHIKKGNVEKQQGIKYFNTMLKVLRGHPDMTHPCLKAFLDCFNDKQKQSIFEQAFRLYEKRPDLQLLLRMSQAEHLISLGEQIVAINKLVPAIVKHSKEGALVLPAMKKAVEIAIKYKVEKQAYKLLKKADSYFPKKRGTSPSEAYAEFKDLLNSLKK